jgi:hypothetical protein
VLAHLTCPRGSLALRRSYGRGAAAGIGIGP